MLKVDGFTASAVSADIRKKGDGRLDMGLIHMDGEKTMAAAVFTQNSVVAPPVEICRARIGEGTAKAVLVNSGNANCMTLFNGRADALRLSDKAADLLGLPAEYILPCSTGVIGEKLPIEAMEAALNPLVESLSPDGLEMFSRAILTTDTVTKTVVEEVRLEKGRVRIAGIAKGSGMIAPNMATMLGFILTDALIERYDVLSTVLIDAVEETFNAITVDGDMSTNDTVILMASGRGLEVQQAGDLAGFGQGVKKVCDTLADMIVADGEGATKVVTVKVAGGSQAEAKAVARAVAESLLVKTALAAADPNWGRIAMAVGKSGAEVRPDDLSLSIGDVDILMKGKILPDYDETAAARIMEQERYEICIVLGEGEGRAQMKTCDLTDEYVRINCEYRT